MKEKNTKIKKFLKIAKAVSILSKDKETKVGAILLSPGDKSIVAVGYNGFVRGAEDKILPKTRPDKYKYTIHAELNLLLNCARHGITTKNKILICTHSPCSSCIRHIKNCGIKMVIFEHFYKKDPPKEDLDLKFSLHKKDGFFVLLLNN